MDSLKQVLGKNISILQGKTNKYAIQGAIVSFFAVIIASCVVSYLLVGEVSFHGIWKAQTTNVAIWILDLTPFIFTLWGQYVGSSIAFEAGIMIADQTQELRTQTSELESKVMRQLTTDSLTGLPNNVLFMDRVNQALSIARHENAKLGVLLIALAQIKQISQSFGRYNSDRLIKQAAVRLQGVIHSPNSLASLDVGEFAVLLPKMNEQSDALELAKNIDRVLKPSFFLEELTINLQAHMGIAVSPEHGSDGDTLLQRAHAAVNAATQTFETVTVYDPALDKNSQRHLILMNDLRRAIESEELFLAFQPQIDIKTNKVISAEALVRWKHPQYGLIPPDDFIPLAERTGLIKLLATWVLEQGIKQCAKWHKEGLMIGVSINLSALDLMDVELPDKIAGLLTGYEVDPKWLTVEITEGAIMINADRALQILERIRGAGLHISIDDFGTGYTSLAYLSKLPVSELKIDKTFVMNMNKNMNDRNIVHATNDLAHNLDLKVVAEGVENQEILDALKKMGCDIAQGYFISKPLAPEDFLKWIKGKT